MNQNVNMDKNIVNEIKREFRSCVNLLTLDDSFLYFYIKLLRLDPNWGISEDVLLIRKDLQNFIKHILKQVSEENSAEISTCRLQFHFEEKFNFLGDLPVIKRSSLMKKISPLRMIILEKQEDSSNLIHRTVLYIILASGLGNPKDTKVFRETEKALRSLWSEMDQINFFNQLFFVREELLDSLIRVTAGIRLYNKDCKKGGHGIPLLPSLLFKAIHSVQSHFEEVLEHMTIRMNDMSIALESCFTPIDEIFGTVLVCKCKGESLLSKFEYYKDLYTFYCLFTESLKKLLDAVIQVEKTFKSALDSYHKTLNILHQNVIPDIHILCSYIFPVFTSLYGYWMRFQDQTTILAGIRNIFGEMHDHVLSMTFNEKDVKELTFKSNSKPVTTSFIAAVNSEVKIFNKRNLTMLRSATFEFNGYCPWKLVSTNGFLVKGSDDFDIVLYKNRLYKFSTARGLQSFIREPDYYINSAFHLARKKPQLILFLRLRERLREVEHIKQLVIERKQPKEMKQVEVQTETHPVCSHIDNNYEWNIWNLKRSFIKMANCTHGLTKSTQSKKCFQIKDEACQVYQRRVTATQTVISNYTNTPKQLNYMHGFRGRKDDKQVVLTVMIPEMESECQNKSFL